MSTFRFYRRGLDVDSEPTALQIAEGTKELFERIRTTNDELGVV